MYNSSQFIEECICSVLRQTYSNWELLLIDDGSTDNTLDIVEQYTQNDKRVKVLLHEKNSGVSVARNTGLSHVTGRYVAFLDSDDIWVPEKLEKQIVFSQSSLAPLVYCQYVRISEKGIPLSVVTVPSQATYNSLLRGNIIACSSVLIDTERISVEPFVSVGHEDYVLWLTLLKKIDCAYGVHDSLMLYRVHHASLSKNKWRAMQYQWYIYRRIEYLTFIKSLYFFIYYVFFNIKKRVYN
jgi:teichuronic acid biosynthesis glycosyltransferase TuaG